MMRLRHRLFAQACEAARVDAWILALHADEPIPFWPMDHPVTLEGAPAETIDSTNGPL